jgi:hypothetical protein
MPPDTISAPGTPVWYHPILGSPQRYAAIVASDPRELGGRTVVRIEGLGDDYRDATGTGAHALPAVSLDALEPRPRLHEDLRQLADHADEAMLEVEAGILLSETEEQLRSACYAVLRWLDGEGR